MTTPQVFSPPTDPAALGRTGSSLPTPVVGGPTVRRRTALREAATFVGLVLVIVLATALALPHAPGVTTPLLTMQTPVFVVLLIAVFGTARGRRRALLNSLGVQRLGLRSWPVAFGVSGSAPHSLQLPS